METSGCLQTQSKTKTQINNTFLKRGGGIFCIQGKNSRNSVCFFSGGCFVFGGNISEAKAEKGGTLDVSKTSTFAWQERSTTHDYGRKAWGCDSHAAIMI